MPLPLRRARLAALLTAVLTAGLLAAPTAATANTASERVGGADATADAVAFSQRAFPQGAQAVYLTRSDVLADALAAGSLRDGPLLYVGANGSLPAQVAAEIARLAPAEVVAVGGPRAVPDAALAQAAAGRQAARLAGEDRYGTAVAISQRAFPRGAADVFVANSVSFVDAVTGSALDGPILPVPPRGAVPPVVAAEAARLNPGRVTALGGTAAVSDSALQSVARAGTAASSRIAGADRAATAAAIAARTHPGTSSVVYLADGQHLATALAAGSLRDGPTLLVLGGSLPDATTTALARLKPSTVVALGSAQRVPDAAVTAAIAAATGRVATPPRTPSAMTVEQWEAEIFRLTNVERVKHGLPELRWDTCLAGLARGWSAEQGRQGKMHHGDFGTRIRQCSVGAAAENVARGYGSPQSVVAGWMNSPGHRANILNPRYTRLGVGVVQTAYFTQKFASD